MAAARRRHEVAGLVQKDSRSDRAATILKQRRAGGFRLFGLSSFQIFGVCTACVGVFKLIAVAVHNLLGPGLVAPDLLYQPSLKKGWDTPDLRAQVACNKHCVGNTTQVHETVAAMVRVSREAQGGKIKNWTTFVEDTCVVSCVTDQLAGTELYKYAPVDSLPAEVGEYLSEAAACREDLAAFASGTGGGSPATTLRRCGIAHVSLAGEAGVTELIGSWRTNYDRVRRGTFGGIGLMHMVDFRSPPLRNNREEVWLPFRDPFTRFSEILSIESVRAVVGDFFDDGPFVVDHVNVVHAPGGGVAGRQDVHSDFKVPGEHLEIHVPLVRVGALPLEMGPTRFCPALRSRADSQFDTDPSVRAIRRHFGDNGACLGFEELSWVLHAGAASVEGPIATFYDASVFHQGLENVSPDDRPVLVVALAASPAAVSSRDYCGSCVISQEHKDAMAGFRSVRLFDTLPR